MDIASILSTASLIVSVSASAFILLKSIKFTPIEKKTADASLIEKYQGMLVTATDRVRKAEAEIAELEQEVENHEKRIDELNKKLETQDAKIREQEQKILTQEEVFSKRV